MIQVAPVGRPAYGFVLIGAVRVLGALHDAGVHVVIVSGRPHTLVAPMRVLAPHAWWVAEHGTWRYNDSERWSGPLTAPEITGIEELREGVLVGFDRGRPRRFDLVIGADGLHSRVREIVFAPEPLPGTRPIRRS